MKKKNVTSKSQQIKQMEEELTTLFGEKSYVVIRKPCSGKYHGHNDYTIVFGSGRHLYVGLDKRNYARNSNLIWNRFEPSVQTKKITGRKSKQLYWQSQISFQMSGWKSDPMKTQWI